MPVLDLRRDQSAIRRNLLASTSGAVIGLFFGVPPAWGAHTIGLPWAPYGFAVIVIGLIAGLLIAFTLESILPRNRKTPEPEEHAPPQEKSPEIAAPATERGKVDMEVRRHRLAEEKARLDNLEEERQRRRNSAYGKVTEERIVWAELLDLELQDVDEQFTTDLDKGGIHERNNS